MVFYSEIADSEIEVRETKTVFSKVKRGGWFISLNS
jgi:hypothetical protein